MNKDEIIRELLSEKSLFAIYKNSNILKFGKFNYIATSLIVIFTTIFCLYTNDTYILLLNRSLSIADIGVSIITNLLGFLIAGFTIFATFNDKEFYFFLNEKMHPDYNVTYLKYVFYTFIRVFIYFIAYGITCVLIKIFACHGGIIAIAVNNSPCDSVYFKKFLVSILFIFICTFTFYVFILLKSFVFNIYHVIMAKIAWEYSRK